MQEIVSNQSPIDYLAQIKELKNRITRQEVLEMIERRKTHKYNNSVDTNVLTHPLLMSKIIPEPTQVTEFKKYKTIDRTERYIKPNIERNITKKFMNPKGSPQKYLYATMNVAPSEEYKTPIREKQSRKNSIEEKIPYESKEWKPMINDLAKRFAQYIQINSQED